MIRTNNLLKLGLALCFCFLMGGQTYAQKSWKSILSGVANAVVGNSSTTTTATMVGTWKYTGPDCKFESDNLLAKAGGEVASARVEEKVSEIMKKVGFTDGATFVFNSDSTYTSTVKGRTTTGTYSYNADKKHILMTTRMGFKFNATVSQSVLSPNKMSLLFKADKMMSLVKTFSGALGKTSSNSAVTAANALLKEYDGLDLGFELEKQE